MAVVDICEVGPRDGLQNEDVILSPEVRGELCDRLAASGLPRIEAVSFVREDLVPAMAGAEEVLNRTRRDPAVLWAALVLNEKGYQRAVEAGVDEVRFAFPVTDTYAARNQRTTVTDAIDTAIRIVERSRDDGIASAITLSAAFGCPFEGPVSRDHVLRITDRVASAQPDTVIFADSIGVGVPRQVRELVGAAVGASAVGCHFHNTRNTGYANALAAVEAGASILDASIGGLGGCPFAPGATGNIATEDLVYLLEGMGFATGIDLDKLRQCSAWVADRVGHELPSLVARAGDPCGVATTAQLTP
ncbi:hydroxymethylglutaryl-CoA lyase [Jiangella mangrovi]|uniref:Hydroxymethylglutaryl-CoA lyase/(R)-citramalyl-CoA lyase n=1 Tax=Jiangella mangrovi TaxID=1524084 RepID=A0A7W9GX63_9ACTN|nr:hydroxymethylglutaryl-CoA lyase [Jiangella mangrovi]MBB5791674.1 hydroxymethylglutaryl-CoA lyase/(R)-citramalyl-CoA lyase [Jiangella mangrovi]